MSRYSGKQDNSGPKIVTDGRGAIISQRPNKGVAKRTKDLKREEAEERNSRTPAERTRKFRLAEFLDQPGI